MADDDAKYTQEELDAAVKEALVDAKAENDEAFKELWREAKEAKAKLRAFGDVDPDEVGKMRTRIKELERQAESGDGSGVSSEDLEKWKSDIRADLEEEYQEVEQTVEELRAENRRLKLDDRVKAMMGKAGVRSERIDPLYRLTADHYDLTDDGEPVVKVKPGKEPEKYIEEDLSKEYPEFFNGSGSSGGGASASSGGAGGGAGRIAAGDNDAFLDNLDEIAEGKVAVE